MTYPIPFSLRANFIFSIIPRMPYPGYNFQSRFAMVGGHRMHYIDEGPVDAEPVVMVHGNPTWSFFFRKLIADLSDRYRTVVPDHVGMGLSSTPPDEDYTYTLASRIDDLEALLEARGITQDITLVLHDWGGFIGTGYAMRHPERIKRLVVLNTAAFHLWQENNFPRSLKQVQTPVMGSFLVRGLNAFSRVAVDRCSVKPLPQGVRRGYLEPYNNWKNRLAVLRFVEDIPRSPAHPAYDVITEIGDSLSRFRDLPVLICWGMQDFIFDPSILDDWVQRLPDAEVHRYADAGHYILEDVGTEVSGTVRTFLENHPLRSSQKVTE